MLSGNFNQPVEYIQTNKITNPFKHVTPMDNNCLIKSLFALAGGTGIIECEAIGIVFGVFTNAVEYREFDQSKGWKHSTKAAMRTDVKRIWRNAKGWGMFGFFWSIFECQLEKMRHRDDAINSFYGGMFTTMLLSAEAVGPKGMVFSGIGGGLFGMIMHKVQTNFMS